MKKKYQVTGIGNAMVDILCYENEEFLDQNRISKGVMQLIDIKRAKHLHDIIKVSKKVSGGSAANTIAGIAKLGGSTTYIGKVKDDDLGNIFVKDLREQGVIYNTPLADKIANDQTGRCTIIVTPDGERTMNTYLGVTEYLKPSDIDEAQIMNSEWIYLEGYRFDGPESHEAFNKATNISKAHNGKVALTLSDPFCVERHREAFKTLIKSNTDLLFCNEFELKALYQTEDLNAALELGTKEVDILACTAAEKGAYIMQNNEKIHVPAVPTKIVDATGAGDMFAGAFLYALSRGESDLRATEFATLAAGEVVKYFGPRLDRQSCLDLRRQFFGD